MNPKHTDLKRMKSFTYYKRHNKVKQTQSEMASAVTESSIELHKQFINCSFMKSWMQRRRRVHIEESLALFEKICSEEVTEICK